MIKVLMLTDRMGIGGVETHIAELARGLRGMDVHVAILSGGGEIANRLEQEGIMQYRVPTPCKHPLRLLSLIRCVRRLVRQEGFDVLHAHSRVCAFALRFCCGLGAARIVTVHARFSHGPLLRRASYWGEWTVAVSEDLCTYVCDVYRLPAARVRVISNGIDGDRFRPPAARTSSPPPSILCASRLDEDCSLAAEMLCALAPYLHARYPQLRIRIAGGGDRYARICAMADEVNTRVGKQIIQPLGFVEDMVPLLQACTVFVGVSRAALEASMCERAVVLCGNEGYFGMLTRENMDRAALSNFCARGCPPPTMTALADDLSALLDSPQLRQKTARDCAERIRQCFGSKDMAKGTLDLYRQAIRTEKDHYITLAGYFGCGNMGDDAILSGVTRALREASPDTGVWVLSGSPARTEQQTGLPCFSRKNPLSILSALLRSDALLLGGGSLLQNLTSDRSLAYYLALIRLSHLLRRPVLLYGIGIGPLLGTRTERRVADVLNRCQYIGLRDEDSHRLLRSLGVDAERLHVGADPALLLPPPPVGRAGAILDAHGISHGTPLLCVALHGANACKEIRDVVLASVRLLCRRQGLVPIFPILDREQDESASLAAAAQCAGQVLYLREPNDLAAILSVCRGLISMRLHALIFAASVGTASVGISADARDGKIPSFAKAVGADLLMPMELGVTELVTRTEEAILHSAQNRPILLDSVSQMRKKARKDLANIVEMIYNKKQ